uniref:alpha/beta fold hydrolase n=1 Tax=Mucilaginibacter sp. TaxID=1882438 RepID=UPI0035BBC0F6
MKRLFTGPDLLKPALIIAMLFLASVQSKGQQIKPLQSGLAPVNGIKVYYEVYGSGKPIVLLHGAFMTIEGNWAKIIPHLAKTRKVIAIEMQGHGHTPYADRKMNLAALAIDVDGVMDYLKVDSADVAGYSMGGTIAYQLAIQRPKRIKKLVII